MEKWMKQMLAELFEQLEHRLIEALQKMLSDTSDIEKNLEKNG